MLWMKMIRSVSSCWNVDRDSGDDRIQSLSDGIADGRMQEVSLDRNTGNRRLTKNLRVSSSNCMMHTQTLAMTVSPKVSRLRTSYWAVGRSRSMPNSLARVVSNL